MHELDISSENEFEHQQAFFLMEISKTMAMTTATRPSKSRVVLHYCNINSSKMIFRDSVNFLPDQQPWLHNKQKPNFHQIMQKSAACFIIIKPYFLKAL